MVTLSKELKSTKDELKVLLRRYEGIEEELAIKNIELKELKQKESYSS
jgi:hypothetical protein